MRRRLRLSKPAQDDLIAIWAYTIARYGERQAEAYDELVWEALDAIRNQPNRPTSKPHPDLGPSVRSFRISLIAPYRRSLIKSARHAIYYAVADDWEVRVLRVLHDEMNPELHLTDWEGDRVSLWGARHATIARHFP